MPTGLFKAKEYLSNKNYIFNYVSGEGSGRTLHYFCDKNHEQVYKLEAFKKTSKCNICFPKPEVKSKELCIEFGLEFIEYKHGRIHWKCPDGHNGNSLFSNFSIQRAWECKECNIPLDSQAKAKLFSLQYKFIQITKETAYQDKFIEFSCINNHFNKVSLKSFVRAKKWRCNQCFKEDLENKVKELIKNRDGTINKLQISPIFFLDWTCKRGHNQINETYYTLLASKHCKQCVVYDCIEPKAIYTWGDIHNRCEDIGYTHGPLPFSDNTKLSNTKTTKIPVKCHCGKPLNLKLNRLMYNPPISCGCLISQAQKEVNDFVQTLGFTTIFNDRKIIAPLELDIFIPELNIAVEYNGLYWHSEIHLTEKKTKSARYHLKDKNKVCLDNGIRLITIFEDEWLSKREQVKGYLSAILGKKTLTIGARKCKIERYGAKDFCEKYHLQGSTNGQEYSLIFNNEIVACALFFKTNASRGSYEKDAYELARYCVKPNISVPGGLSKLIAAFKKDNPDCRKLISYSDNRWSVGNLYKYSKFKKIHDGNPTYWYWKRNTERQHRFAFTKNRIIKKYNADPTKTEWQIMQENGWDRIWDLGATKWELEFK